MIFHSCSFVSCNLDSICAYVHKVNMVIINCSLTMITSCSKMVNLDYVVIGVTLALNEQIFCNWCTMLMCMIMPHVRLGNGS